MLVVSMHPPISVPAAWTDVTAGSRGRHDPTASRVNSSIAGRATQSAYLFVPCRSDGPCVMVAGCVDSTTSIHDASGAGTRFGVSIRFCPCSVTHPSRQVSGSRSVEMSE